MISCDANWQLFLDNHVIARSTGLSRVLCPPRSRGVVIPADRPWETQGVQVLGADGIGRRDDGSFFAFYRAMWWDPNAKAGSLDRAHWSQQSTAYATSDDGIHWTKPNLRLTTAPAASRRDGAWLLPVGSTMDNNIGIPLADPVDLGLYGNVADPNRRYAFRVLRDAGDPAAVSGAAGFEFGQACFSSELPHFPNDGSWRKNLTRIDGRFNPRRNCLHFWDSIHNEWVAIEQGVAPNWLPSREIARFATKDFHQWTSQAVMYPDAEDPHRPDQYDEPMTLAPYCAEGVVFGLLSWFITDRVHPHGGMRHDLPAGTMEPWRWWRKGVCEVRLTISRDGGKTWDRTVSRQPWIPRAVNQHEFDFQTFRPTPPVRVGDEDWFYTTVIDGDHLAIRNDVGQPSYYHDRVSLQQIALYTQKHNRYVALRAPTDAGEILITQPLVLRGDTLELNVDASHGQVRVAVAAADGQVVGLGGSDVPTIAPHLAKPLPGMTFDDCVSIRADSIARAVQFKSGTSVASLGDRAVYLLFEIRDADLFGFRCAGGAP